MYPSSSTPVLRGNVSPSPDVGTGFGGLGSSTESSLLLFLVEDGKTYGGSSRYVKVPLGSVYVFVPVTGSSVGRNR